MLMTLVFKGLELSHLLPIELQKLVGALMYPRVPLRQPGSALCQNDAGVSPPKRCNLQSYGTTASYPATSGVG